MKATSRICTMALLFLLSTAGAVYAQVDKATSMPAPGCLRRSAAGSDCHVVPSCHRYQTTA